MGMPNLIGSVSCCQIFIRVGKLMNTLLVTHHWPPFTHHSPSGGYQRLAFYMARLCHVDLLMWHKRNTPKPDDRDSPFPVHRVVTPATDMFLERRLMLSWHARKMASSFNLVHALYSVPALFPAGVCPTVATVHVLPEVKPGLWTKYHGIIQRVAFKKCNHIIAVSNNLYDILAERYGPDKVTFIPHGIDIHVFKAGRFDTVALRRRLLQDRFRLLVLQVGVHGSDLQLLIELAARHQDILFLIINRARPHRLSNEGQTIPLDQANIKWMSDVSEEDMVAIYDASDIFLRPLKFATANNSILEAMAMSKPIITQAIPGVTDYLDDSTAFLTNEHADLISQFEYVVEHPDEREQKGRRARARAEEEFAWEHVAQRTLKVYERVV
jgi:glycosyltransferase involved in cell wall biosynthesis